MVHAGAKVLFICEPIKPGYLSAFKWDRWRVNSSTSEGRTQEENGLGPKQGKPNRADRLHSMVRLEENPPRPLALS